MPSESLTSRYNIQSLVYEDILTYVYMGSSKQTRKSVRIIQYKGSYLTQPIIRSVIDKCAKLTKLRSENTLAILDYAYDGEDFYIVYEWQNDLIELSRFLKHQKTWSKSTIWKIATQVLRVMLEIESHSLGPTGLRLNQIFVGQQQKVKLLNLCIPMIVLKENIAQFNVMDDAVFLPPELVTDQSLYLNSDIYSFGTLLYFLFSGKWPYDYTSNIAQLKKGWLKSSPALSQLKAGLPKQLVDMIHLCLVKDAQKRISSFGTLVRFYKGDPQLKAQFALKGDEEASFQKRLMDRARKNTLFIALRWAGGVAAAGLIVAGVIAGNLMYQNYFTSIPEIRVPEIVGMGLEQARGVLKEEKMQFSVSGRRSHPTIPKNHVIDVHPGQGRKVKQNRLLKLIVSTGPGDIQMPDMTGRTLAQAVEILKKYQLTEVEIVEIYSQEFSPGIVASQTPTPNFSVIPSQNIQLLVSKGFPVTMDTKDAKPWLFIRKDHLLEVTLNLAVLDEWPTQNVRVEFRHDSRSETLYSQLIGGGQSVTLKYELDKGGYLEVFFNDELAFKEQLIKQPSSEPALSPSVNPNG